MLGVAFIKIVLLFSSSSRNDTDYNEAMEGKSHLDSKVAGHGGGGSVVPMINAGGVTKFSSRASMAGDRIGGGYLITVV